MESQPMSFGFIWRCPAAWRFCYGGQTLQGASDWN
jgi:hypothetical protein